MSSSEILPRTMVLEEFTPHLEQTFQAECVPKSVDLTLVEAYPLKDQGVTTRPPFILIFHSAPNSLLLAGTYVMRSGKFDPFSICIEPTMPALGAAPGHYYQAVFN